MATSVKDAKKAGKLLRTSKSKNVRSVAGSDLAQTRRKAGRKQQTLDSKNPSPPIYGKWRVFQVELGCHAQFLTEILPGD
jgi:hypothetical protein